MALKNPLQMKSLNGVYNQLLLVPIVGGACFTHHQLAAVFNASFSVFQMTLENSHVSTKWEEKVTFVTLRLRMRETSQKWQFC